MTFVSQMSICVDNSAIYWYCEDGSFKNKRDGVGKCVEGVGNTSSRWTFYEEPLRCPTGDVM